MLDSEMGDIRWILDARPDIEESASPISRDGINYMPETLRRSGETNAANRRDRFPAIACGRKNSVYVAYTTNRNGNSDIFLDVYRKGKKSGAYPIAGSDADEFDPSILVDAGGDIWVSWASDAEKNKYNIFVAALDDPEEPAIAERATNAKDDAMRGRLAMDGQGTIWLSYYEWRKMGPNSRDKEVYIRRFDAPGWSDAEKISPNDVPSYEDHADPCIAGGGPGAVVAWSWDFHQPNGYTRNAKEPTIFFRPVFGETQLGAIRHLSAKHIDTAPAISVDADNYAWCAWDSLVEGIRKELWLCRSDLTVNDQSPEPIQVRGNLANVCTPTFAKAPDGALTLVWSETADGKTSVLKKMSIDREYPNSMSPQTVLEVGNPRFASAAYDDEDVLWIACSVETERGREIQILKD